MLVRFCSRVVPCLMGCQDDFAGFTLSELLVVLVIMSAIAMLAIPFSSFLSDRSDAALLQQQLLQAVRTAPLMAFSRHEKLVLCSSENQQSCGAEWQQGFLLKTAGGKLLQIFYVAPSRKTGRIHARFFPAMRNALVYSPLGMPEIENGTFWYCSRKHEFANHSSPRWAIVINQAGRIRIDLPDARNQIIDSHGSKLLC